MRKLLSENAEVGMIRTCSLANSPPHRELLALVSKFCGYREAKESKGNYRYVLCLTREDRVKGVIDTIEE